MLTAADPGVDTVRAAVVAIDLHRGHLDLSVAIMRVRSQADADRILAANARFLWCRARSIPVLHMPSTFRDAEETRANPFRRSRAEQPGNARRNAYRHNLAGSPGCEVMPQVLDPRDWILDTRRRYKEWPAV